MFKPFKVGFCTDKWIGTSVQSISKYKFCVNTNLQPVEPYNDCVKRIKSLYLN